MYYCTPTKLELVSFQDQRKFLFPTYSTVPVYRVQRCRRPCPLGLTVCTIVRLQYMRRQRNYMSVQCKGRRWAGVVRSLKVRIFDGLL